MHPTAVYDNPLISRYASRPMAALWSPQRRITTWRKLWVELARAEHELGLPISMDQIQALEAHIDSIDFAAAAAHEKRLRHDVMAHVHTYGDAVPRGPRHHPSGSDKLLRHRQHRPDPDPRGASSYCATASSARSMLWRHSPNAIATSPASATPTSSPPSSSPSASEPRSGAMTWSSTSGKSNGGSTPSRSWA